MFKESCLTGHEGVVIWVGETRKVRSHVIHFDTVVHNFFKSRQVLQIIHVVIAEAVNEKDQKFSAVIAVASGCKKKSNGESAR